MTEWRCDCPVCRLLARPLVRLLSGRPGPLSEEIAEKVAGKPFEVVKVSGSSEQGGAEAAPAGGAPGPGGVEQAEATVKAAPAAAPLVSQEVIEATVKDVVSRELEEIRGQVNSLNERLSVIEEELEKLKKNVEGMIDEVKAILVDVKAGLTEAQSPFAQLLRSEEEVVSKANPEPRKERREQEKLPPSLMARLLRWVNSMLKSVPKEHLVQMIRSYYELGVIDEHLGKTLEKLVDVVDKLNRAGVDVEKQVASLYSLAKSIGISDQALDSELVSMLMNGFKMLEGSGG